MATRLYLPASGTAPLASLAFDANWELTTSASRLPCATTKSNTALADTARTWGSETTQQWIFFQYQTATMKVGYSWTSDTVSMVIRCLQAAAQTDSHLAYSVRVVSADGSTVRGTIGLYHATSSEIATSAQTRIHSARGDGSGTFTSYVGDRIIVEIGLHGVSPTLSAVTLRMGDPSATADFALTAGLTTDLCPWVELSRTVTFGNASIAAAIATGGANTVSGTLKGKGRLYGASGGVATVAGNLGQKRKIYGATDGVAAVSGTLTGLSGSTEYIKGSSTPFPENIFRYSEQLDNAAWGSTVPANAYCSDTDVKADTLGNLTLDEITIAATANFGYASSHPTVIVGQTYSFSFDAMRGTNTDMFYGVYDDTNGEWLVSPTSYYSQTNGSTASRISVDFTVPAGCTTIYAELFNGATTGTFYAGRCQLAIKGHSYITTTSSSYSGVTQVSGTLTAKGKLVTNTDIVPNGTFDTATGWELDDYTAISGGTLNYTNYAVEQFARTTSGSVSITAFQKYLIEFEVKVATGSFYIGDNSGSNFSYFRSSHGPYSVGVHSSMVYADRTASWVYFWIPTTNSFSLDNFKIKTSFQCAGISTVSGTLKAKGSLYSAVIGANEIVNGTFDSGDNWDIVSHWTIADGKATYDNDGGNGSIRQFGTPSFTVGSLFKVTLDFLDISSGDGYSNIYGSTGGYFSLDVFGGNGHYVRLSKPDTTSTGISIYGMYAAYLSSFSIDNVTFQDLSDYVQGISTVSGTLSAKGKLIGFSARVGTNLIVNSTFDTNLNPWAQTGSSWSWQTGGVAYHTAGESYSLRQTILTSGIRYILIYTIKTITAGSLSARIHNQFGADISVAGTYVFTAVADGMIVYMTPVAGAFVGTIDDIYVYAVLGTTVSGTLKGKGELCSLVLGSEEITNGGFDTDTSWTKKEGWSIANGVATFNSASSNGLSQDDIVTVDHEYRIRYQCTRFVIGSGGGVQFNYALPLYGHNSVGVFIHRVFIDTWPNIGFWGIDAELDIDNVSAKEVTDRHCKGISTVSGTLKGKGYLNNMLSNVGFDNSNSWTQSANWIIGSGVATFDDVANGALSQDVAHVVKALQASTDYVLRFEINISGSNVANFNIADEQINHTLVDFANYVDGYHTLYFTTDGSQGADGIRFYAHFVDTQDVFSIDNISLKPMSSVPQGLSIVSGTLTAKGSLSSITLGSELYDQEAWYTLAYWPTRTADWSQVGNTLVADGSVQGGYLVEGNFWTVGSLYKTYASVIVNSGTVCPIASNTENPWKTTVTASHIGIYRPGNATRWVHGDNTYFNGSVIALSAKPVTVGCQGISTVSGTLQEQSSNALTGSISSVATVTATLLAKGRLGGTTDGVAAVSGVLKGKGSIRNIGENQVANGTFDSETYWSVVDPWSVADGVATYADTASGSMIQAAGDMLQNIVAETLYKISFDISIVSGNSFIRFHSANTFVNYTGIVAYADGHHDIFVLTAASVSGGGFGVRSTTSSNSAFDFDNLGVYDLTNAVNGISTVSGTLKGKGRLLGHTLGSENISNGTFDSSTGWTFNTPPWTIANGIATYDKTLHEEKLGQVHTSMVNPLTDGTRYNVSWEIIIASSYARLDFYNFEGNANILVNTIWYNGYNAFNWKAVYDDVSVWAYDSGGVAYSVDNFSIKEITNQVAGISTVSGTLQEQSSNALTGSISSVATVTATLLAKGRLGGTTEGVSALTADLNGKLSLNTIIANGGFDYNACWVAETGWTIANGVATFADTGNARLSANLISSIAIDTSYRLSFDIDITSGTARIIFTDSQEDAYANGYYADGHHEVLFTSNGVAYGGFNIFGGTSSTTSFTIDNVSLKRTAAIPQGVAALTGVLKAKGTLTGAITSSTSVSGTLKGNGWLSSIGAEQVVNGRFNSADGWSYEAAWSISDGVATYNGGNGYIGQTSANMALPLEVLTTYRLYFIETADTYGQFFNFSETTPYLPTQDYYGGVIRMYFTTPSDISGGGFKFHPWTATPSVIDDFSIKKWYNFIQGVALVSGTLTPASATEYIDGTADGVSAVSGVLVAKGSLSSVGAELVANEWNDVGLTWWDVHDTGWTGDGEKINFTYSSPAWLAKNTLLTTGNKYRYKISAVVVNPEVDVYCGASPSIALITTTVSDKIVLATANDTYYQFWVPSYAQFNGSLTKLSAAQLTNYCPSGISTVSGVLKGKGRLAGATEGTVIVSGSATGLCVLYATADGVASASATLRAKGRLNGSTAGVANLTTDLNAEGVNRGSSAGVTFLTGVLRAKGSLSSITLGAEKITNGTFDADADWDTGSSWTIHDGKAYSDGTGSNSGLSPSPFNISRYTHCVFEADVEYNSGSLALRLFSSTYLNASGHYKFQGYISSQYYYYFLICWAVWDGSIDNITVKEIAFGCQGISTVSGTLLGRGRLVGRTDGIATASIVAGGVYPVTASTAGIAVLTGVLKGKGRLYGATNGVAVVSATLQQQVSTEHISGTTAGVTALTATLKAKGRLYAAITGVAAVSGTLVAKGRLSGTTGGVAALTADLNAESAYAAQTAGVAVVSATLVAKGRLYGSSNGIASLTGNVAGEGSLTGAISSQAVVSGVLLGQGSLIGLVSGIASVSATLIAKGRLVGRTDGTSTALIIAEGMYPATGRTDGVALLTGVLKGKGRLAGSTAGVTSIVSLLEEAEYKEYIAGTTGGVANVSATLRAKGRLYGTINGVSTASGYIPGEDRLFGQTDGVAAVSGVLYGTGVLQGLSSGVTATTSEVGGRGDLAGAILSYATLEATLVGTGLLTGQTDGIAYLEGDTWGISEGQTFGRTDGTTNVAALLRGRGQLQGAINGIAAVIGIRAVPWLYEKIEKNSYITGVISKDSYITTSVLMTSTIREEIVMNSIIKDDDE